VISVRDGMYLRAADSVTGEKRISLYLGALHLMNSQMGNLSGLKNFSKLDLSNNSFQLTGYVACSISLHIID